MIVMFPGSNAEVCSVDSDLVSRLSIAGRPLLSTSLMAMLCECAPRHSFSRLTRCSINMQHDG